MPIGTINRIPFGLLDFFKIKQGGRNPQELGASLQPTLDMFSWYAYQDCGDFRTAQIVLGGATSDGALAIPQTFPADITTGGQLVVPADETWLMLEASVRWTISDAAGTADFWLGYDIDSTTCAFPMDGASGFTTGIAGITRGGRRALQRPVFVPPGATIRFLTHGATLGAGGVNYQGFFRLFRMRR